MTTLGNRLAGQRTPVNAWVGEVSSLQPLTVMDGSVHIPVGQVGNWAPLLGDKVLVLDHAGKAWCVGPLQPHARPDVVEVTSLTSALPDHLSATDQHGNTYELRWLGTYTPTVGHTVAVLWGTTQGIVIGTAGAQAGVAPSPTTPTTGVTTSGVLTLQPVEVASWRAGSLYSTTEVIQGTWQSYGPHDGAYFYGGVSSELAGATITSARIYLDRMQGGFNYGPGEPVHLHWHPHASRPAVLALDSYSADVTVPLGANWYPLDLTIAQALTNGGGVGVTGMPYVKLKSASSGSGLIELAWTRTT